MNAIEYLFNIHKVSNVDYRIKRNEEIIFARLAGYVSMKHSYIKILALDFKLFYVDLFKGRQVSKYLH